MKLLSSKIDTLVVEAERMLDRMPRVRSRAEVAARRVVSSMLVALKVKSDDSEALAAAYADGIHDGLVAAHALCSRLGADSRLNIPPVRKGATLCASSIRDLLDDEDGLLDLAERMAAPSLSGEA